MFHRALLFAVLVTSAIQAQDTPFAIGFTPGTTCAEVQEREGGHDELLPPAPVPVPAPPSGAKAPAPKSPSPWSSFTTRRSLRDGLPTVRYSCDGNARVRSQSVEITFESRDAALAGYAKYAKQLRPKLGAPCWDSDALGAEQRKSLQDPDDFLSGLYRQRLEWRGSAANTILLMSSRQGSAPTAQWFVRVDTLDSRVRNDDMGDAERKIRALGTCDPVVQLPSVSDSDDAPTVLTKWFAHVRERGYPATVDFLASEEKRRVHAAAIELARRAQGTPAQALLGGLAGTGIPADQVLGALERSTPDAWLRELLNARFRSLDGLIRYSAMEILGTIPEGDITHVIARMHVAASEGEIVVVQSFAFKRSGGRMEMLLPEELQVFEMGFRIMTHTLAGMP